ncbi:MAG TPA: cysteine hydrolase [Chloroflexi bacterium]|nr:MAG: isochorismatase [Chloroflexota bacterium]HDD56017.1 cysteine hydrolase [Chloroflexota bacterium]
MKERYFQPDTIGPLSGHWQDLFASPRKNHLQPFRINQAALLLLDMQEYFLDPESHAFVPSGEFILPNLNFAVRAFRQAERPVLATRHANSRKNAGRMDSWWSELLTEDHPRGGIHPNLEIEPEEIILKTQYDAFYQSELEQQLTRAGVEQLVIGGVVTHLCCETTARSAFVRGYEVFFLIDGTATYSEAFHTGTLRNLGHGFAVLTTVKHLLGEGA